MGSGSTSFKRPAAAAAVVAVIAMGLTAALLTTEGERPTGKSSETWSAPATWRTEYWHGVQVRVPPDWGWGGAPSSSLSDCGTAAYRTATGENLDPPSTSLPYVGRPVALTDTCRPYDAASPPEPTADFVWLGSPDPAGTVDLGAFTQETIVVAGVPVTVATRSADLRTRILSTVTPSAGACPAEATGHEWHFTRPDTGMVICVFQGRPATPHYQLIYEAEAGPSAAAEFQAAWRAAPRNAGYDCWLDGNGLWVTLFTATKDYRVTFGPGCPEISTRRTRKFFTAANTLPWAVGGLPLYVTWPVGAYDGGGVLREGPA